MICKDTPAHSAVYRIALLLTVACLFGCTAEESGERSGPPAPVEVALIEQGRIEMRRTLSGSLLPSAEFAAAARIDGQIRELKVRVADPVKRGAVLATLDDADQVQGVLQAEANLLVAKANLRAAKAREEIAAKDEERIEQLRERGIASEAQVDSAQAERLSAEAGLAVAEAQIARSEAELESAEIELRKTKVTADWTEGSGVRVVAERFVDEGDSVSANQPLFRIVDLDPLVGVVRVTERDYPSLAVGEPVSIRTDSFPGEIFSGEVRRIAPVFSEVSRQARVEFEVPNPDFRLKPGMFVRATVVLAVKENATVVPDLAIVRRDAENGVFVLDEKGTTAFWRPVGIGIREGSRVEIIGDGLSGRVITLGQQLVEDGSEVRITRLGGTGKEE